MFLIPMDLLLKVLEPDSKFKKIKLSHPKVERYFMSNLEATNLILTSLKFISEKNNQLKSRTFICDMGDPIKIKDLVIKMLYLSGRSPKKIF